MDVDFTNSPPEAQVDLMTMMFEMEKLANFSKPPPQPSAEFASGPPPGPAFYNAPNINNNTTPSSSLLIGVPSSIPFSDPTMMITSNTLAAAASSSSSNKLSSLGDSSWQSSKWASVDAMREMIFRIAAMQPIHIDPESVKPPKRRNVRISKDPQSVAARHRRERISERIRILQRLVPGGTKMDTASMLDEAIRYMKFLKAQVQSLERAAATNRPFGVASTTSGFSPTVAAGFSTTGNYFCFDKRFIC